jgi:hypothetical protein
MDDEIAVIDVTWLFENSSLSKEERAVVLKRMANRVSNNVHTFEREQPKRPIFAKGETPAFRL